MSMIEDGQNNSNEKPPILRRSRRELTRSVSQKRKRPQNDHLKSSYCKRSRSTHRRKQQLDQDKQHDLIDVAPDSSEVTSVSMATRSCTSACINTKQNDVSPPKFMTNVDPSCRVTLLSNVIDSPSSPLKNKEPNNNTDNLTQSALSSPSTKSPVSSTSHPISKTPEITQYELLHGSKFRFNMISSISFRESPLPSMQFADSDKLWESMVKKEKFYIRDPNMLNRHPTLQARMRAILLDWLTEVCEVYRLHRETFYLAVDFIDRYLMITFEVQKQQLQLIGISALFVSAKLEEIYPPKLSEFAYVTDGACKEDEILQQELVLLKALKWDLSPMTVNSWLNVFLQLVNLDPDLIDSEIEKDDSFVLPQYSPHAFIQIARLLDLVFLEIECLQFCYSVLATSAVYHMSSKHVALQVSGYEWSDIEACVHWMAPYAMTLRSDGPIKLKFLSQIDQTDVHNIQTHSVDLSLLERAQQRRNDSLSVSSRASPDTIKNKSTILTPPQTVHSKKDLHHQD